MKSSMSKPFNAGRCSGVWCAIGKCSFGETTGNLKALEMSV